MAAEAQLPPHCQPLQFSQTQSTTWPRAYLPASKSLNLTTNDAFNHCQTAVFCFCFSAGICQDHKGLIIALAWVQKLSPSAGTRRCFHLSFPSFTHVSSPGYLLSLVQAGVLFQPHKQHEKTGSPKSFPATLSLFGHPGSQFI